MFRVDTQNGYKLFVKEEDANNYKDFLENGLKIVRKCCGGWLFNDGSILFDISIPGTKKKTYSLKQGNKNIKSEKLLRRYIEVLVQ